MSDVSSGETLRLQTRLLVQQLKDIGRRRDRRQRSPGTEEEEEAGSGRTLLVSRSEDGRLIARARLSLSQQAARGAGGVLYVSARPQPVPSLVAESPGGKGTTPNVVKRRRLIDRNVKVGGPYPADGGCCCYPDDDDDDCGGPRRQLNFSYSNVSDSDDENPAAGEGLDRLYEEKLSSPGNKKRTAAVAKKFQTKTSPKLFKARPLKNLSKLADGMNLNQTQTLLGYDWIVGLLGNDPSVLEQSDTYFEDLKNFWKTKREEFDNDFYSGTSSLQDLQEPSIIEEILRESKIKSYRVNERLFPKPLRRNPLTRELEEYRNCERKKPSQQSPNFVRVSVPRRTLLPSPSRKPSKQNDSSSAESFSLTKNCVLGWESSRPAMMPTASTIGIKAASEGMKNKETLTLDEAERLAAGFGRVVSCRKGAMTAFNHYYDDYQQLMRAAMAPSAKNRMNCHSRNSNKNMSTEELLNCSYSLMREMDRIKEERELRCLAKLELGGIPYHFT